MIRLGELDIPDRLASLPVWVTQMIVAFLCLGIFAIIRRGLDMIAAGAAPFALVFPAIMISTLFARWPAGALTGVISISYAWFVVFPTTGADLGSTAALLNLFSIAAAALLTLALAEFFRRAVRQATSDRDRQIADRDLFLAEFDHRVKNNFAIVASLLELQRRGADPATAEALTAARLRVDSIARAHRHLYRGGDQFDTIEIGKYLTELCGALSDALTLGPTIDLICDSDSAQVARDRAVSIGLIVNELVINAAKHAFAGRETGRITVSFRTQPDSWRLTVADDGVGVSADARPVGSDGGLGSRLIEGFARQARGAVHMDTGPDGTTVTLDLQPGS